MQCVWVCGRGECIERPPVTRGYFFFRLVCAVTMRMSNICSEPPKRCLSPRTGRPESYGGVAFGQRMKQFPLMLLLLQMLLLAIVAAAATAGAAAAVAAVDVMQLILFLINGPQISPEVEQKSENFIIATFTKSYSRAISRSARVCALRI